MSRAKPALIHGLDTKNQERNINSRCSGGGRFYSAHNRGAFRRSGGGGPETSGKLLPRNQHCSYLKISPEERTWCHTDHSSGKRFNYRFCAAPRRYRVRLAPRLVSTYRYVVVFVCVFTLLVVVSMVIEYRSIEHVLFFAKPKDVSASITRLFVWKMLRCGIHNKRLNILQSTVAKSNEKKMTKRMCVYKEYWWLFLMQLATLTYKVSRARGWVTISVYLTLCLRLRGDYMKIVQIFDH